MNCGRLTLSKFSIFLGLRILADYSKALEQI